MGKGIFTRGNFTNDGNFNIPKKIEIKVPFKPPVSLVNSISLNVFNKIYFASNKLSKKTRIESYDKSLYPLDNILEWNKIYGKRVFINTRVLFLKKTVTMQLLKCWILLNLREKDLF